ncbi:MAG: type IV secretory system conjugative DNA transfer family protein [Clostridiaceae bacterium]|nr:type IV secretory system conjugative DNA transfer family protein [Clostridiaceae bacterium]
MSKSKLVFAVIISALAFLVFNRFMQLYTTLEGDSVKKILDTTNMLLANISKKPFEISFDKNALIAGAAGSLIPPLVYLYTLSGRNNFLVGMEYGSSKWGTPKDIANFTDKIYSRNILFTKTEMMSLDTRKTFRNNNVLVIGGSGSGKTRFFVKPNLMQLHSSYVITDPKGSLIKECGKMFQDAGYRIKVLNLIDMKSSDKYNFFSYINDEKDILKLVTNLITNTNAPNSKNAGDFWEKSETALLQALFGYVFFEALPEEKNIGTVMEMLRLAEVREDQEDFKSPLDILFESLKAENPEHFACKQYDLFKLAAGKTAKSILVSVGVRLSPFNITVVSDMLSEDTIAIDTIGDEKTALFVIIPDSDRTFNFISAIMYQQLFDTLFLKAENEYGGRLPYHVRFLLDEFANIGQIPNFEIYIATMRSREISVNVILQNVAQLKNLYKDSWETITGNCDTLLFLGGKEQSTLEYISKMVGKTTIDLKTTNESKGQSGSYSINNQVLGRELITPSEVGLLGGTECILSIRGIPPFKSQKFDITKHNKYKELSDYDRKNSYILPAIEDRENSLFFSDVKEIKEYEVPLEA